MFGNHAFARRMTGPLLLILATMGGCATPGLQGVLPYQTEIHEANRIISAGYLPPARGLSANEWHAAVNRVITRIGPAAYQTCLLTRAVNCSAITDRGRVSIVDDPTINAYVDRNHQIGLNSGLINQASSDNEIAAVLAHEYGHILAGHHADASYNETLGTLVGGLIGVWLAYETGVNQTSDWAAAGAEIGVGAFSQEFELEADYYAALILSNAGIDLDEGRNLLLRLARTSQGSSSGWGQRGLLMANTHPSDDFRIARWLGIARSIEESKEVSPDGKDDELRLYTLNKLLAGNNGQIWVNNMERWVNPQTGASGMMTLTGIRQVPDCGKTCVSYRQADHQQGASGIEYRYACWIPGGPVEYHGTKRPWKLFGGAGTACNVPPAVGVWGVEMNTPLGMLPATLTINEDGTGSMAADGLGEAPISGIVFNGPDVYFETEVDAQGTTLVLEFNGSIEGDSLAGEFDSDFGAFGVTGSRE